MWHSSKQGAIYKITLHSAHPRILSFVGTVAINIADMTFSSLLFSALDVCSVE